MPLLASTQNQKSIMKGIMIMKKRRNMAAAILLASLMATSVAVAALPVSAASTLTVNQATGDESNHTYTAYPVMTGNLANDKQTLTELQWATGFNSNAFVAALKAFDNATFGSLAETDETAANVAAKLKNYSNVEGLAKVFNSLASAQLGSGKSLTKSSDGKSYSVSGLDDGWYVVIDSIDATAKTPDDATGTTNVRSANLLQVIGDTTAGPKYSVPTLTKVIVEDSTEKKANQAAIGDTVTYKITVPVPDMTGYSKYYYIVDDTLSKGLTYTNNVTVTYGTTALTLDTDGAATEKSGDFYVTLGTYSETDGTAIRFVFENFYEKFKNVDAGTDIIITYTAVLNDKANITDVGNPNTAKLIYSNDPNYNETGTPDDKPDEPDTPADGGHKPVGETPEDKVKTYTTQIKIKKVDQDGNPLKGATFTLTGDKLNRVIVSSGTTFGQDDTDGTYWKLKNGSYTSIDPNSASLTEAAKKEYSNDGHKYKKVELTNIASTQAEGTPLKIVGIVDDSGILTFTGLAAGNYKLEETGVPEGYNKAPDVTFTLKAAPDMIKANWTTADAGTSQPEYYDNNDEKCVVVDVVNNQGATLPSTGGIGTTIFYVVGGTLVLGAVVLLITKKRMSVDDEK